MELRSTAHIRPFFAGQLLSADDFNQVLDAMRHMDGRLSRLEDLAGLDVPALAPPYDPNENPLPLPGGDWEDLEGN